MRLKRMSELTGTIRVPGDKSISHRSVILGSIAEGDTLVRGFLKSADCISTVACLREMGVSIEEVPDPADPLRKQVLRVRGTGLRGLVKPQNALDAGNSGTTVRLLAGILAGQGFDSVITGDLSLSKRPMRRIMTPLETMGISVESLGDNDCLPLLIRGGSPKAARYRSRIASAQVKSCVLLAALYAEDPTFYSEPSLSRNHTELMLTAFGGNLKIRRRPDSGEVTTILYPGTVLSAQEITVPGDISSAAYFLAAGLLVPRSEILLTNVGINETRYGILRVIRDMGGRVDMTNVRLEGGEPVADLLVRSSSLHGTVIGGPLIPTLIDELPVIAVMASFAEGKTVIQDAAELRVKESDRIAAVAQGLRSMGITVDETEDGMVIFGGKPKGALIRSGGDHRIAMAFSVAGICASGTTEITDTDCVKISYPNFYRDLMSLT